MIRRITIALAVAVIAVFGVTPTQAAAPTSVAAPAVAAAPAAAATGWKLGGLPNSWTICVANGVGTTYVKSLVERWNAPAYRLKVSVLNRCDSYSITNRMTLYYYNEPGSTTCAKFENTHKSWDAVQRKYIWDQNVILKVNINDYCASSPTEYDHRFQMYTGYLFGLYYDVEACDCVMGSSSYDLNNSRYVTYRDVTDMNEIYK